MKLRAAAEGFERHPKGEVIVPGNWPGEHSGAAPLDAAGNTFGSALSLELTLALENEAFERRFFRGAKVLHLRHLGRDAAPPNRRELD